MKLSNVLIVLGPVHEHSDSHIKRGKTPKTATDISSTKFKPLSLTQNKTRKESISFFFNYNKEDKKGLQS